MSAERLPVAAGRFYPGDADGCIRALETLLPSEQPSAGPGAIVPHAGWVYSGSTAALGLSAIARAKPETVVLFGAAHGPDTNPASVYTGGFWRTPLGSVAIDAELAALFVKNESIADAPGAHEYEHSLEVQVPFLQRLLPKARIVPINVRPGPEAVEVGQFCAARVQTANRRVAFVGSTDLTHYGPSFGFEPHGRGAGGIRWAKEVNDRRLISLIAAMKAEEVVPEVEMNRNACGAGAVAALVSAMRELGATEYEELRHTCSAEAEGRIQQNAVDSVGYEAGVFRIPVTRIS